MFDANTILKSVNFIMVFAEGLLSFFSPCVLPLLPLYIGYLSGNVNAEETNKKSNVRVLLFTIAFILGIFLALFLMNISITVLASFFTKYQQVFTILGGIIILVLGLHQLGVFKLPALQRNLSIKFNPNGKAMSFSVAFIMGFTFSFAWTPCIGPALSSILILASNSESLLISNLLVLTYALGLTLPFLLAGIFTNQILRHFAKFKQFMNITVKIGAVLLILMGALMISGQMKNVNTNFNVSSVNDTPQDHTATDGDADEKIIPAPDFELTDLDGESFKISDYKGKVVFLNFWGTWCPPCQGELPHVQALYDKYKDSEDVVILTIVGFDTREKDEDGIRAYMETNDYTFRAAFDSEGLAGYLYGISSFPTTFMIDRDSNVFGYVRGALDLSMMEEIIDMALTGERR